MGESILSTVDAKLQRGERITDEDAVALFGVKDLVALGKLAHRERTKRHGRKVYTRTDLNVNHTNICAADCGFCAFFAKSGSDKAYLMTIDEIEEKAKAAYRAGVNEWHVVGGLTPECDLEYFEEMFRRLKTIAPHAHIQGMTGVEIDHDTIGLGALEHERWPGQSAIGRLAVGGGKAVAEGVDGFVGVQANNSVMGFPLPSLVT